MDETLLVGYVHEFREIARFAQITPEPRKAHRS
jgi:hypothetical protein